LKIHKFFLIILIIPLWVDCEWNSYFDTDNPAVHKYIELLRANKYDSLYLPRLSVDDIPALLKYRNESLVITKFPRNPISSYYNSGCRLGVYVLWSIESIRSTAVKSPLLILGFPSQNPMLVRRNVQGLEIADEADAQEIAAKAYYDWWYSSGNPVVDPLEKTKFMWH
jgi:hypothetical protein